MTSKLSLPSACLLFLACVPLAGCGDAKTVDLIKDDCVRIRVSKPHADLDDRMVHWEGLSAVMEAGDNCGFFEDYSYQVFVDRNGDTQPDADEIVFGGSRALAPESVAVTVGPQEGPFEIMEGRLLFRVTFTLSNGQNYGSFTQIRPR